MIGFVQILAGLALFLFGINMLSGGMEKLAGEHIQKWLDRVTSNRFKSAIFGTVATALIQSSGLLMVMMIGLINANIMTVPQAIAIMLGQEIGTTVTAQIVAFNIGNYRLILIIAGFIFYQFFEKKGWKKYGEILLGLGMVFIGMSYMSHALDELIKLGFIKSSLVQMSQYPLVAVLAGVILTGITQSSTAMTSLTVAMGMSNVISLEGAVGLILGANIGSCITGFIAAVNLSAAAKRTSIAQIMMNVAGVLVFLPFIDQFSSLISHTSQSLPRQIANAHSIFNLVVSAALFPFVNQISSIVEKLFPDTPKKEAVRLTAFIDENQFSVPAIALKEASREMVRLGQRSLKMVENCCVALTNKDQELAKKVIDEEENFVDPVFKLTVDFVNKLLLNDDLSAEQKKRCFQLKNLLMDIERIADMAEEISTYAISRIENNITFSTDLLDDISKVGLHAQKTLATALSAFETDNKELAKEACEIEKELDRTYWKIRHEHIVRWENGTCTPEANVIFTEVMHLLERVSDHADNIGVSVMSS
jgi:phosphate:Na+ symporter